MDAVGKSTLELFDRNPEYNRFLWRNLNALSAAEGDVLEVGCGIGNLTRLVLEGEKVTGLHGIDMDPSYVHRVLSSIDDERLNASVSSLEEFTPEVLPEAASESYDSIVCSNVLEHISDDVSSMVNFHRLLKPGGKVLLLVPAHPWVFSQLDRNLSHHRRYTTARLRDLGERSLLTLEQARHFNPLGLLGWWVNGKLLGRSVLPATQLRLYTRLAIPLSQLIDRLNPFPLGVSLLALFRKSA